MINADQQLQLNALEAGTSSFYRATNLPDSLYWEIYIKMTFNPSNNNNLRVYLQADDEELIYADGYFLQLGENLAEDAIQLWRSDGGTEVLLETATLSAIANSPAEAKVRVERDGDGTWRLFADYTGGNNFNLEFTVQDATYGSGDDFFFGLRPKYTSGNVDNFFFDDVVIAELLPDVAPPALILDS